jgi:hypothetical protein
MTDLVSCEHCGTRLLIVRDVPALDYGPDPAGRVAVSIDDPRRGRFLAHGEAPGRLEHAHGVHACEGTRAAQRAVWRQAAAGLARDQRNRRGVRRPAEPVPGARWTPPALPGMPGAEPSR